MLRWEEKEDVNERHVAVDAVVAEWRRRDAEVADELREEFNDKLQISWIFHDSALEGEVLTHSEIKAATDRNIISDVSLIPSYEDIKAFDSASRFALEYAANKKKPINLDFVRAIFNELCTDEDSKGMQAFRKENPLHRLYYHVIAPPDKVAYRMRKFGEWLESPARKDSHPIERATETHRELMGIFPWAKGTGRVARILSNAILHRHKHPLAVIHSIDRQRYYDALRTEDSKLELLYLESVETTAASALRVYAESASRRGRRGRRAS
jgi:Fic family protein